MANYNNENKTKEQIICEAVCGILMLLSVIVYILIGFLANLWHPGWLVIVCSALVCGIINCISNLVINLKQKANKEGNDTEDELR